MLELRALNLLELRELSLLEVRVALILRVLLINELSLRCNKLLRPYTVELRLLNWLHVDKMLLLWSNRLN